MSAAGFFPHAAVHFGAEPRFSPRCPRDVPVGVSLRDAVSLWGSGRRLRQRSLETDSAVMVPTDGSEVAVLNGPRLFTTRFCSGVGKPVLEAESDVVRDETTVGG